MSPNSIHANNVLITTYFIFMQ